MDSIALSRSVRYCSGKVMMCPSILIQFLAETGSAESHDDHAVDQQSEHLRPQHECARAFQKDAANNLNQIAKRVQESQILNRNGHVTNGIRKPAQHESRDRDQR